MTEALWDTAAMLFPWLVESTPLSIEAPAEESLFVPVRSICALVLAFVLSLLAGPRTINWLRRLKVGQQIRDSQGDGAISLKDMHLVKAGTPTMGGVLMIGTLLVAALILSDWTQPAVWMALAMMLGFGGIGFWDDYLKVSKKNSDGLSPRGKLLGQAVLGLLFGALFVGPFRDLVSFDHVGKSGSDLLVLPFAKGASLQLGWLYLPFAAVVLMGMSNAVNLTDGLDGLAAGVTVAAALGFAVLAYLVGRGDASASLLIPHVRGGGELAVLLAALGGSCLGFLWFNCHPAKVFMGDTGSMMIGGLLASVALLLKQEVLLLLVGGVFVMEALSVIIQVTSYKLRKKRVFLMSPLHHHFERKGVAEPQIIVRFWIISAILALVGLSTLKLR